VQPDDPLNNPSGQIIVGGDQLLPQTPEPQKPKRDIKKAIIVLVCSLLAIVLIAAVAVLLLRAKGQESTLPIEQNIISSTKTFTSETGLFALDYPSDWRIIDRRDTSVHDSQKGHDGHLLTMQIPSTGNEYGYEDDSGERRALEQDDLVFQISITTIEYSEKDEKNYQKKVNDRKAKILAKNPELKKLYAALDKQTTKESFQASDGTDMLIVTKPETFYDYNPQGKVINLALPNGPEDYIIKNDIRISVTGVFNLFKDEATTKLGDDFVFEEHPQVIKAKEVLRSFRFITKE
jgi:hypothetical protein